MAANPANPQAFRALVELHGQRGNWLRAAAYLTCASGYATDPAEAIELALEAAEVFRNVCTDVDGAIEQYTRILERSPGHARATAAWRNWPGSQGMDRRPAHVRKHGRRRPKYALNESAQLWQKVAWSAQMLGDMERARAGYRRSYAALPTYLPTLQGVVATRPRPGLVAGRLPDRAATAVATGGFV